MKKIMENYQYKLMEVFFHINEDKAMYKGDKPLSENPDLLIEKLLLLKKGLLDRQIFRISEDLVSSWHTAIENIKNYIYKQWQ